MHIDLLKTYNGFLAVKFIYMHAYVNLTNAVIFFLIYLVPIKGTIPNAKNCQFFPILRPKIPNSLAKKLTSDISHNLLAC